MKKLLVLCLCLISVTANAARVIDGINYEFDRDNKLAYVVAADASSPYTGKIVIPEKVKVGNNEFTVVGINKNAFIKSEITDIDIPNTVVEIQQYAFQNCRNLRVVHIGSGVKSIGESAFHNCKNLTDLTLPDNKDIVVMKSAFLGLSSLQKLVIPDSWTQIGCEKGSSVFSSGGFKSLYIGKNVKTIWDQSFSDCSYLSEIICPDDCVLEEIKSYAFSSCESLTTMKFIPKTVKKIGKCAFWRCNALLDVFIPGTVDSFDGGSYEINTKRFFMDDGPTPYSLGGNRRTIVHPVYAYLGREMTIDPSWGNCQPFETRDLKRVDFGPWFKGGSELSFGKNVEIIYSCVTDPSLITCKFEDNVYDNAILYVPVGLVDKYMAQDNFSKFFDVREFYPEAYLGYLLMRRGLIEFADLNVKNICLENWDTNYDCEIDENEVEAVTDIGKVFRDEEISTFDEFQYFTNVKEIPDEAFCYSPLTSIVFPKGVETIGYGAFCRTNFESIELPEGLKSIGESAFCATNLKTIELPEGLITIGKSAFEDDDELVTVIMPQSVKTIGDEAFGGCDLLTDIYCAAEKVPSAGANTFERFAYSDVTLHVPSAALNDYKSIAPWKNFKKIVAMDSNPKVIGDVDGDGKLTKSDIKAIADHIVGKTPAGFNKKMADANEDGKVNAVDIVLLVTMMK